MSEVIHGTGKPRFIVKTPVIETGAVNSVSDVTVILTLDTFPKLSDIASLHGLIGTLIWTKTSTDLDTAGVIESYNDVANSITVRYWTNGVPEAGKRFFFANIVIDLPYCQSLVEYWYPDGIVKRRLNGDLKTKKKGFYYRAELYFDKYISGNTLSLIRNLYRTDRKSIIFYPRRDNNNLFYEVDIDMDKELSFYQLQHHQGHGGVVINIIGLKRYSEAQIYNIPASTSAYGSNYGTIYGGGL